ncbi:MAG: S8 family serine peptidase, partial [Flammeovirgaceae bacterium]|nr:S8 family serine peptidase [Flammeovirgaceae bacterium]MDW8287073.1 S8 family serine peptidase [Flammeovirgaceae bacterium]
MRLLLFLSFWLIAYPFLGQQRQLVLFKDKTNSPYSLENPTQYLSLRAIARRQRQGIPIQRRDLPVNPSYVNELKNKGAKVLYTSRWLNGAVVEANASVLSSLQTLSFVKSVGIPVGVVHTSHYAEHRPNDIDYGRAAAQNKMLGIDEMHRQGYKGKGIIIAVMDAGFERVKQNPLMTGIDILDTYDFVDNETDVYDDDSHGAKVLSTIAANGKGIMVGAAFEASFYLYRTEDVRSETRLEEVYWTIAAERADSLGADIISNSLAYSTFDAPDISYTLENLNGDYALISQAADWAASTGMLVVTSADNLGYNTWRKISFPADADSVLAVGAVTPDGRRAGFSSVGNTVDNRIKPDVVALGENAYVLLSNGVPILASGTSYSAPQVAGLAAGLWQAFPHLSNMKLLEIIRLSGSQMSKPDSLLGYGIPHFTRAKELAAQVVTSSEKNMALQNVKAYPNPLRTPSIYLDFPDILLGKEIEIK